MIEAFIGLAGVIVGSMITISKDIWVSKFERRREGSYSAIRLICILEEYADKCIDVVSDDGTVCGQPAGRTDSGEEYCAVQTATPNPPEYPEDIGWRSINEPLMHRVLALTNKARSTDRHIAASAENAFPPDYEEIFESRQEGYARLGLDALGLAEDLRQQFDITTKSRVELGTNWDSKVFLRDRLRRNE